MDELVPRGSSSSTDRQTDSLSIVSNTVGVWPHVYTWCVTPADRQSVSVHNASSFTLSRNTALSLHLLYSVSFVA
jgi:hypothetical protein